MKFPGSVSFFWSLILILYFGFKNKLVEKITGKKTQNKPLLTIIIAILSIFINLNLEAQYNSSSSFLYLREVIKLPPFTVIFIFADFFSTVLLTFLIYLRNGKSVFNKPYVRISSEFIRLVLLLMIFNFRLSSIQYNQFFNDNMSTKYTCFQNQVAIDFAAYYFRNNQMPAVIEDFTENLTNPLNNSPLIYIPGTLQSVKVVDEKNNTVLEGYKDLAHIEIYEKEPDRFFKLFEPINEASCSNTLIFPSDFKPE